MSHALLLRLFLSPSFFSVHVALRYLMLYADNIGITYYLTRRLADLDTHELREVWGFICHLLVTRPSKSRALECFVVDIAQRSTHIAMLTLWFMQASLQDFSATPTSQSFLVCQRTLHRCHEIIFAELPPAPSGPYSGLSLSYRSPFARRKVKPCAEPALVGMGLVLVGVPALPALTEVMGEVALRQGRTDDDGANIRSVEEGDNLAHDIPVDTDSGEDDDNPSDVKPENEHTEESGEPTANDSEERTTTRSIPHHRRTIVAAQTSPALIHLRNVHRSRLSEDPLDQQDPPPGRVASPYQSSPSISSSPSPLKQNTADALLQRYDIQSQSHFLRSQYCRSELQFILTLESISHRLLVVPKPARVSALRAELTALNHQLPAEVCMPMWCSSSDTYDSTTFTVNTQSHHKIVRIPPGEAVVLNSAERAPYLLLIEILNDDLSFDPSKRSNREILKRIVSKENERKGASKELITFGNTRIRPSVITDAVAGSEQVLGKDTADIQDGGVANDTDTPRGSNTALPVSDDEEMDLVEQVYGEGQSLRGPIDLTETIVLPPAPKNRELELAAWSRCSPVPSSPVVEQSPSITSSRATPTPQLSVSPRSPSIGTSGGERILSLDDYSERMRTAAIMLSQLNASLVRETVTPLSRPMGHDTDTAYETVQDISSSSSSLSWLPGSSWLGVGASDGISNSPVHPPLGGNSRPHDTASAPITRMRVQHAEAAAIRDRIMQEMLALEEERMARMREGEIGFEESGRSGSMKTVEDERIIKRELSKVDPSAVVFSESWVAKKSRIRHGSPYGHLANWDCVSVIVKTGGDLRQEQVAVQLIREFERIWQEEGCQCWVRYFRILITGASSGLVETITDAVSMHSIKKAEYARRLAEGRLGYVTLLDHFRSTYGDPSTAKFARAQRNLAKSLAGYSIITYLLQIKDRHNGNILLDREGHLIHIDFGFMLSNSPGNIGFEAAPFKLSPEYVEVLGGVTGEAFLEFRKLFREGFEVARKHCDRIITLVELMQKDSTLPCFAAFGDQTVNQLRERFQPALTHSLVGEYVDRLIDNSLGSNWTRLYDLFQYYSQSIL
ncbi:kinase-like protein [Boletus edulis BED1]|uniref:1-phosphatidylinositol 4-kinase n=1 Tax=Boletus edulis BED1 TaxID=1328754 RepID=A0AAD4GKP3_BOLED|nr:kinase-like protein [Boletus edulis BED1]